MIPDEDKKEIVALVLKEVQGIVDKATETAYLGLPELTGNLMTEHMALHKINKKFYDDNPDFKGHTDAVQSVVEMVEGDNTLLEHEDILKKATPKIRERINTLKNLDMTNVSAHPDRTFQAERPKSSDHGKL